MRRGRLSQPDSRSLWYLSELPPWSIPLLLMLMANHTTPDGHYGYYWRLIKSSRPRDCGWGGREKYLSAFWLGSDYRVMAPDALPGGRATVPFTEAMATTLLAEVLDGLRSGAAEMAALEECRLQLRAG